MPSGTKKNNRWRIIFKSEDKFRGSGNIAPLFLRRDLWLG